MSKLDGEQYVSLATFRKTGKEVLTPVWFAADPKDRRLLWIYTNVTSGKVKRVRNNGRARVAPCNGVGKLKGDFIEAKARMVEAGDPDWQRGWDALHAKYWMLSVGLFVSRFTGRYAQRGLMAVELKRA
jgi:PPOX class probable F420-dependent enzyme